MGKKRATRRPTVPPYFLFTHLHLLATISDDPHGHVLLLGVEGLKLLLGREVVGGGDNAHDEHSCEDGGAFHPAASRVVEHADHQAHHCCTHEDLDLA